jgi:uncharacterized protein (TIGR02246 family)
MGSFLRRIAIVHLGVLALLVFGAATVAATEPPLPESDRAAIEAVLEHFRSGWLAGNADAVRSTFTSDAVLMPHHGLAPVVGMAAMNEFWWPAGTAKTTITRFVQKLDEIGGSGNIAYLRGRSEVAWTVEDQKTVEKWQTGGNFMAVLRKQPDGKWRMSHLIWDDPPNQRIDEHP